MFSTSDPTRSLQPHGRIIELDALRACAALSLIGFHFTHVYQVKFGYVPALGFEWPFGAYGVELFFILSGYVNSMSLLRRGNPADFVAARLIRIIPVFMLVIVANAAVLMLAPYSPANISMWQWLANLTLMPRVFGFECIDPVMWTLQVEMMFYVTLAVLYRIGGLRRYFIGWGALLAMSLTFCPWLDSLSAAYSDSQWFAVATAIRRMLLLDSAPLFVIGFLLYMIQTRVGKMWQNIVAIGVAAAVFHSIDHGKHNLIATLLIIATVLMAAKGKIAPLRFKPLVFISTISYPLYLCHNNLGCALIYHLNHVGVSSEVCLVVAIAFSFAAATLVTTRVEQPITSFLRNAWQRRVSASQNTASANKRQLVRC